MRRALLLGGVLAVGCGCPGRTGPEPLPVVEAGPDGGVASAGQGACEGYGPPLLTGHTPPSLPELSGLAASRLHPGIYWAHNDSGHALELFALGQDGQVVATFALQGARSVDVEDVAVGPCPTDPEDSCVYLADIGDNLRRRSLVQLLWLPEPRALEDLELEVHVHPFAYEDQAHDAEGLVVDARGVAYVITKTTASLGAVYRVQGQHAAKVGELRAPFERDRFSTAADLHPSGERLLLRTYGRVWELSAPGATGVEQLLLGTLREVPAAEQPQGEAVAYAHDGRGYLLGSEGVGAPLFFVSCRR
jgi:hypothetical protein